MSLQPKRLSICQSSWNGAAVVLVTLVAGLILAACGGKTAGGSASTTQGVGASSSSSPSSSGSSSTSSSVAAGGGGQFCQLAASLSKVNVAQAATGVTSQKAAYAKVRTEEPIILAAAPGQLKGPLEKLFGFYNKLYSALAKVNYNFAALPTSVKAGILGQTHELAVASKQVVSYLSTTCHVKANGTG